MQLLVSINYKKIHTLCKKVQLHKLDKEAITKTNKPLPQFL